MANPYSYYPEGGMLEPAIKIADTATRLYGIREHSRLSEGEQALQSRRNDILQQQANTQEQWRKDEGERLKATTPVHKGKFNPSDYLTFQGATNQQYGPEVNKALGEYYDFIKDLAMKGVTKQDAYQAAKSVFPAMKEKTLDKLMKTDTSTMTPEGRAQFNAFLDTFATDDGTRTLDQGWFVNTAGSIRQEQENSKAELAKIRGEYSLENTRTRLDAMDQMNKERIAAAEARREAADARRQANDALVQVEQPDGSVVWMKRGDAVGKPVGKVYGPEKKADMDKLNSVIAMNNDNYAPLAGHIASFNKGSLDSPYSYWEGEKGGVVKIQYGVDSKGVQITNDDVWREAKRTGKSFGEVVGQLQKMKMADYVEMPKPPKK